MGIAIIAGAVGWGIAERNPKFSFDEWLPRVLFWPYFLIAYGAYFVFIKPFRWIGNKIGARRA